MDKKDGGYKIVMWLLKVVINECIWAFNSQDHKEKIQHQKAQPVRFSSRKVAFFLFLSSTPALSVAIRWEMFLIFDRHPCNQEIVEPPI